MPTVFPNPKTFHFVENYNAESYITAHETNTMEFGTIETSITDSVADFEQQNSNYRTVFTHFGIYKDFAMNDMLAADKTIDLFIHDTAANIAALLPTEDRIFGGLSHANSIQFDISDGNTATLSYALGTAIQSMGATFVPGDAVNWEGTAGGDTMYAAVQSVGNAPVEVLADHIHLDGLRGDDYLRGGASFDQLSGGSGHDVLVGGGGEDTFRFSTAASAGNVDQVVAFDVASDSFEFAHSAYGALDVGGLTKAEFKIGTSATTSNQHILYDANSGNLFYDADGSGHGAAVEIAQLDPHLALTIDNFHVV
jgi:Ca2+-binding RTX toxin-like protein